MREKELNKNIEGLNRNIVAEKEKIMIKEIELKNNIDDLKKDLAIEKEVTVLLGNEINILKLKFLEKEDRERKEKEDRYEREKKKIVRFVENYFILQIMWVVDIMIL